MGHSKRKQLDPSDNETSTESESDDMPKRSWIIKEIVRVVRKQVRKEVKTVKSDLKEAKKDIKLLISLFTDKLESRIPDTVKGKKVQLTCSSVKDDDTIEGEVREESEHSSSQSVRPSRSSGKRRKRDEVRNLQLHFKEPLPSTVYTDKKLAIHVELVDANTGHTVESGPESSVGVQVVVLEDSGTVGNGEKSVARDRPGKGPLLIGDHKVNLKGGSGLLDVQFTQVSKWSIGGKFRLEVSTSQTGFEYIHEVISEPISVMAGRGEAFKKSDRPQPDEEVWRLKKIRRNGAFHNKLKNKEIHYVGEFVQLLNKDEKKLRNILGATMTNNNWRTLTAHARQCPLNEERDADKFSPKQENHEDTIGKASSSFQNQVSENPAPSHQNMAPSTCAAPVVPEAPPANVGSIAEGHNDVIASSSPVQSQNTYFGNPMTSPANGSVPLAPRPPIPTCCLGAPFSTGDNTITTFGQSQNFTSQSTMPSHVIGSPSQRDYTLNGNVPPSGLPHDSLLSFPNGHNGLTASPSPVQPQNTYLGNPMKSPVNSEDFASQPTVPSRVISSPSQMEYTWNGNVPTFEPHRDSLLSFRKGHNGAADLPLSVQLQNTNCEDTMAFPVDENASLTARQSISADCLSGLFSQGDNRISSFGSPIRSPIAPCPEGSHTMEKLHVEFFETDNSWPGPTIDNYTSFQTPQWDDGQAPSKLLMPGSR